VLDALGIPLESQLLTFGKISLQAAIIGPRNPRSIFFNDAVTVGWVPGEPFVEIAAQDPRQGAIFYTLNQRVTEKPHFARAPFCNTCHESYNTLGVPGMLVRSVPTTAEGIARFHLGNYVVDHRSPLEERWAGWVVTGGASGARHLGNTVIPDLEHPEQMAPVGLDLKPGNYLSSDSDIAALLVFDHQMRMMNLLTRIGWEARMGNPIEAGAREVVDYLLFIDEAPLGGKVRSSGAFAAKFSAQGPRDSKGRSLRQLDLERRLLRYPCSYMIYSEAFDGLPAEAREAIYKRMRQVLSGEEQGARYARLSAADRRAIVEILRETRSGLPEYFAKW
jgi:hypothetical protein